MVEVLVVNGGAFASVQSGAHDINRQLPSWEEKNLQSVRFLDQHYCDT